MMLEIPRKLMRRSANLIGYDLTRTSRIKAPEPDAVMDAEFGDIHNKYKAFTMQSKERLYALYQAVRFIIEAKVPRDFVNAAFGKAEV